MPIEIKELVIRTVVGPNVGVQSGDLERGGGLPADAGETPRTEEIVEECVRQVLRVLKQDKER